MAKPRPDKSLAARRDYLTRGRDPTPVGRPLRHLARILEVNAPSVAMEFASSVLPTIDALGSSLVSQQPKIGQVFSDPGSLEVRMDVQSTFSASEMVLVGFAQLRHTDPVSRTMRMAIEVFSGATSVEVCVAHSEVARNNFFNLALPRAIYLVRGMTLMGEIDALAAGETIRITFLFWPIEPGAYVVGMP